MHEFKNERSTTMKDNNVALAALKLCRQQQVAITRLREITEELEVIFEIENMTDEAELDKPTMMQRAQGFAAGLMHGLVNYNAQWYAIMEEHYGEDILDEPHL
jgi:hypothetical protein